MNTPVNQRWLYQRSFVVDGNFHGDHMKMRRPDDDVELADGLGFVVEDKPYKTHLSESKEIKQVWLYEISLPEPSFIPSQKCTCHNHRAMGKFGWQE